MRDFLFWPAIMIILSVLSFSFSLVGLLFFQVL